MKMIRFAVTAAAAVAMLSVCAAQGGGFQQLMFSGVEAAGQGLRAYNALGPGPAHVGHPIPPAIGGGPSIAYYFIDTRTTQGIQGTRIDGGFQTLGQVLGRIGKSVSDLRIRLRPMGLGDDRQGQEWKIDGTVETRRYRGVVPGGGTYIVSLGNEDILVGAMPDVTLRIDYRNPANRQDDVLSATSVDSTPARIAVRLSDNGRSVADAILEALGRSGWRFNFKEIQPAPGVFRFQDPPPPAGQPLVDPPVFPPVRMDGAYFNLTTVALEVQKLALPKVKARIAGFTHSVCGQSTGTVTLQIDQGTAPFTVWSSAGEIAPLQVNARQQVFRNLAAGDPLVCVRDSNGDTALATVHLPCRPAH